MTAQGVKRADFNQTEDAAGDFIIQLLNPDRIIMQVLGFVPLCDKCCTAVACRWLRNEEN